MISGKKIQPGEALILFDEIQECPEALNTLDISPLTFDEFLEAIDPAIYPYYDGIQKRTTDRRDFSFAPVGGLQLLFYQRKIIFCSLTFSKRGYRKDGGITNLPLYLVCKTRDLL